MKIACVNCMVPGTTLTEKAEKLRKWGFDGISLQIDDSIRSEALNEEILSLKENTGVQICEFSFLGKYFGHHMSSDPEIKKKVNVARKLLRQGRVNFITPARYTKESRTYEVVCSIIDKIRIDFDLARLARCK